MGGEDVIGAGCHSERSEESGQPRQSGRILRCAQNDRCGLCVPQQKLLQQVPVGDADAAADRADDAHEPLVGAADKQVFQRDVPSGRLWAEP